MGVGSFLFFLYARLCIFTCYLRGPFGKKRGKKKSRDGHFLLPMLVSYPV